MILREEGATIAERLRRGGAGAAAMGSPLSARIAECAAQDADRDGDLLRLLTPFERYPRIGIRLLAALHYLALSGQEPALAKHLPTCGGDNDGDAAWAAARDVISRRPADLTRLLERTPQTNEPARSMPLLGAALTLSACYRQPIRLFEIGASAGLNLRFDRFAYEGAAWAWGGRSALTLRNREAQTSGRPHHLDAELHVAERRGCDLHPLNVEREGDRLELRSFIWPDQVERIDRLDAAMSVASEVPAQLDCADALVWLGRIDPIDETTTVIFHSVFFEHLMPDVRDAIVSRIRELGARATATAPVAWIRMEAGDRAYETTLTMWPANIETAIARSDGHAQRIEWIE